MIDIVQKQKELPEELSHITEAYTLHAKKVLPSYAIALEGWRRGLNLSMKMQYLKIAQGRTTKYTLSDGKGTRYEFSGSSSSITTKEAKRTCMNKELTKIALDSANVPQAKGKDFPVDSPHDTLIQYANEIGYPIVLKPNDGQGSKGVVTNIKSDQELIDALDELMPYVKQNTKLILEKFHTGVEYRFYVIGDKVATVTLRFPANVIGDGKSTIGELIEVKNKLRKKNNGTTNRKPITLDKELFQQLELQDLTLDSVPNKDQLIMLKTKGVVAVGGETLDVTEDVPNKYKEIAVKAVKAIKGLNIGAADLLIDFDKEEAIVIEVNSKPAIDMQMFPSFGKTHDIPKMMIDYLFPDTVHYDYINGRKMYFDVTSVFELTYLKSAADFIKIPKIPNDIILKKYVYTINRKHRKQIINKARLLAHIHKVSGYCRPKNNTITLEIGGNSKNVSTFTDQLTHFISESDSDFTVDTYARNKPVKQGFIIFKEVKKSQNTDSHSKNVNKHSKSNQQNEKISIYVRIKKRLKKLFN